MVSGASSLGTPGLQQATPYGGSACRVLAGASTAKAQMATQVAQLLAEFAVAAEMEVSPQHINLARTRLRTVQPVQDEQAPHVQHRCHAERNVQEAKLLLAAAHDLLAQARQRRNAADDRFVQAQLELVEAMAAERKTQQATPVLGNTMGSHHKRRRVAEAVAAARTPVEAAAELECESAD